MTDRVRHLTVTLDRDMREDDVQVVVKAIQLIRFVSDVEMRKVTFEDHFARSTVRSELQSKLVSAVMGVFDEHRKSGT